MSMDNAYEWVWIKCMNEYGKGVWMSMDNANEWVWKRCMNEYG